MSATVLLGTKKVKLPPPNEELVKEMWNKVMYPWSPTWKVRAEDQGEGKWKYSLSQKKQGQGWVYIDCCYDVSEGDDHDVYFVIRGLPGELHLTWTEGDLAINAFVNLGPVERPDYYGVEMDEGVVVVDDPDNVCYCMECDEPIEGITSYEYDDDSKLHLCAACEAAQA
jgi:hypothetical protein